MNKKEAIYKNREIRDVMRQRINEISLDKLVKERPVIYEALLWSLKRGRPDDVKLQNELLDKVRDIRDKNMSYPEKLTVEEKFVINLCIEETLAWIHNHPSHEWKFPLLRLSIILHGGKGSPEPIQIPHPSGEFDEFGRYVIKFGCREIHDNKFCGGTMVSNFKKDDMPKTNIYGNFMRAVWYTCDKCGKVKMIR